MSLPESAALKINRNWRAHSEYKKLKKTIRQQEKPLRFVLLKLNDIPAALVKQDGSISVVISFWWSSLKSISMKSSNEMKDIIKSIEPELLSHIGPFSIVTHYNDDDDECITSNSSLSANSSASSQSRSIDHNILSQNQHELCNKISLVSNPPSNKVGVIEFENDSDSPPIHKTISSLILQRSATHSHTSHGQKHTISNMITSFMSHIPWHRHHQEENGTIVEGVGLRQNGRQERAAEGIACLEPRFIPRTISSNRRAMSLACDFQRSSVLLPGCGSNLVIKIEINTNKRSIGSCIIDTSAIGGLMFHGGRLKLRVDPTAGGFLTRSAPNSIAPAPSVMTIELGLYNDHLETQSQWVGLHTGTAHSHFTTNFHIFSSHNKVFDSVYICIDRIAIYIYHKNTSNSHHTNSEKKSHQSMATTNMTLSSPLSLLYLFPLRDITTVTGPSVTKANSNPSVTSILKSNHCVTSHSVSVIHASSTSGQGDATLVAGDNSGKSTAAIATVSVELDIHLILIDKREITLRFSSLKEAKVWTQVLQRLTSGNI